MKSKWTQPQHATDADRPHRRHRRVDFQARRVRRRLMIQMIILSIFMLVGILLLIFLMLRFQG